MKKIEFYIHPIIGKEQKPTEDKFILLHYFLADFRYPNDIEGLINELETVQSGEKTFEEVFNAPYGGGIPIGVTAGEFECDKDTAYFISNHPDKEPSIEMPLQELIDLLREWKAFRS